MNRSVCSKGRKVESELKIVYLIDDCFADLILPVSVVLKIFLVIPLYGKGVLAFYWMTGGNLSRGFLR